MELFRISRKAFSKKLSGKGSAIKGQRWNSKGIEMIYLAENRSLAMAEVAVHLSIAVMPDDFVMLTIHIPDSVSMQIIHEKSLPREWNMFPHSLSTQRIGDRFIRENRSCVLRVPSSVTRGDYNFLVNPRHAEFRKIKILSSEPFPFDKRIFR